MQGRNLLLDGSVVLSRFIITLAFLIAKEGQKTLFQVLGDI